LLLSGKSLCYSSPNTTASLKRPHGETIGGDIEARARAFGLDNRRFDDGATDFFESVESGIGHVPERRRPGMLVIDIVPKRQATNFADIRRHSAAAPAATNPVPESDLA
jgi:hypothetical protein